MRKNGLAALILIAFILTFLPVPVHADSDFEISDGTLVKYSGSGGVVSIPEGITMIAHGAFSDSNITKVIFPSSVKKIEQYAFYGCDSLTSITLPDSVTEIGEWAFAACHSLKNFNTGNGLTSMGPFAVAYCRSLETVIIGKSLKKFEENVFYDCDYLDEIKAVPTNKFFTSINGILFSKDKSKLMIYPKGKTESTYTLPDYVKCVDSNAFDSCDNVSEFAVIKNHKYLSAVDGVLYNKSKTELIRYPEGKSGYKYAISNKVITICNNAFYNCEELNTITIPKSVTNIGDNSFCMTPELREITIPGRVTSLGKNCFYRSGIKKAIFSSKSLINIGDFAFSECTSLQSFTFDDSLRHIGDSAFNDCPEMKEVILPRKLETIGSNAFEFTGIKNLIIPDNILEIGSGAFSQCESLENVTIGEGLTRLNSYMFSECRKLSQIKLGTHLKSIGSYAFDQCAFTELVIPNSVTTLDENAIFALYKLGNVFVPDSVTSIGDFNFHGIDIEMDGKKVSGFGLGLTAPLKNCSIMCTNDSVVYSFAQKEKISNGLIRDCDMDDVLKNYGCFAY